jgi:hypothetical protein
MAGSVGLLIICGEVMRNLDLGLSDEGGCKDSYLIHDAIASLFGYTALYGEDEADANVIDRYLEWCDKHGAEPVFNRKDRYAGIHAHRPLANSFLVLKASTPEEVVNTHVEGELVDTGPGEQEKEIDDVSEAEYTEYESNRWAAARAESRDEFDEAMSNISSEGDRLGVREYIVETTLFVEFDKESVPFDKEALEAFARSCLAEWSKCVESPSPISWELLVTRSRYISVSAPFKSFSDRLLLNKMHDCVLVVEAFIDFRVAVYDQECPELGGLVVADALKDIILSLGGVRSGEVVVSRSEAGVIGGFGEG